MCEHQRRAEGATVAHAAGDLDLVLLDALAATAAETAPPAGEPAVDGLAVEGRPAGRPSRIAVSWPV